MKFKKRKDDQDPKIGEKLYEQFMNLFFEPEIKKRQDAGILPVPAKISRMQVIFFPTKRPPLVQLNNEVVSSARVKLKSGVQIIPGKTINQSEIQSIEKIELTEKEYGDCGHITFLFCENKWNIFFDFRRNKEYAKRHLSSAKEFFETAEFSLVKNYKAPFVDTLFSSAELLAKCELLLLPDPKFREKASHTVIKSKFNRWTNLGNVDIKFKNALNELTNLRINIRYLKKDITITDKECNDLINTVKEWIEYTEYLLRI